MSDASALAYKAYEIEELVDIYFYRRAGYVIAVAARLARLTPNALSIGAGVVGMVGGALLAWPQRAPLGVALLVLHGIVDSADGQLARMTGQTSQLGRVLDGLAGYATHVALYLGLVAAVRDDWGLATALGVAAVSGACTALQAQMYDYHRTAYAGYAIKGRIPTELAAPHVAGPLAPLASAYAAVQHSFLGLHRDVEAAIAGRAIDGAVADPDRHCYRTCFYRPVRGWNVMGDNVRRYAIAVGVWFQHPEWFMTFTLVPLNLLLLLLWWYQQAADRRFLATRGQ